MKEHAHSSEPSATPPPARSLDVRHASQPLVGHDEVVAKIVAGNHDEGSDADFLPAPSSDQMDQMRSMCHGPLGQLRQLPPEVRTMIWKFLFRFPWPIVLTKMDDLSSHAHH